MTVTSGLIQVHLKCGHSFEAGFLEPDEKATGQAVCPICKQEKEITHVFRGIGEVTLEEALA